MLVNAENNSCTLMCKHSTLMFKAKQTITSLIHDLKIKEDIGMNKVTGTLFLEKHKFAKPYLVDLHLKFSGAKKARQFLITLAVC